MSRFTRGASPLDRNMLVLTSIRTCNASVDYSQTRHSLRVESQDMYFFFSTQSSDFTINLFSVAHEFYHLHANPSLGNILFP